MKRKLSIIFMGLAFALMQAPVMAADRDGCPRFFRNYRSIAWELKTTGATRRGRLEIREALPGGRFTAVLEREGEKPRMLAGRITGDQFFMNSAAHGERWEGRCGRRSIQGTVYGFIEPRSDFRMRGIRGENTSVRSRALGVPWNRLKYHQMQYRGKRLFRLPAPAGFDLDDGRMSRGYWTDWGQWAGPKLEMRRTREIRYNRDNIFIVYKLYDARRNGGFSPRRTLLQTIKRQGSLRPFSHTRIRRVARHENAQLSRAGAYLVEYNISNLCFTPEHRGRGILAVVHHRGATLLIDLKSFRSKWWKHRRGLYSVLRGVRLQGPVGPYDPGASDGRRRITYGQFAAAVRSNDRSRVSRMIRAGADVNMVNPYNGSTALSTTAWNNTTRMAALLIRHGARVNHANHRGHTALYFAALKGDRSLDIARLLLRKGARVDAKALNATKDANGRAYRWSRRMRRLLLSYRRR